METFSAIVTLYDRGESTGQWWIPLTKACDAEFFYVLFVLHLNKWLNKHSKRRWFQTPSRSSCDDVTVMRCPTPNRRQGINNHQIRIMCMLSLNLLYFIITRCNISRASIFLEISKDILNDYVSLLIGSTILTHWGRLTHISVGNLTIICSDNGLSPGRCQAIIWIAAGLLSIGPCEHISMKFETKYNNFFDKNAFENAVWKMAAILSWPQCVKLVSGCRSIAPG